VLYISIKHNKPTFELVILIMINISTIYLITYLILRTVLRWLFYRWELTPIYLIVSMPIQNVCHDFKDYGRLKVFKEYFMNAKRASVFTRSDSNIYNRYIIVNVRCTYC